MELIEVIGVDPSLRFTGIGKVSYNTETNKFAVSCCQVIQAKTTLKGTDKISDMLMKIQLASADTGFIDVPHVIVESPVMPFYANFQASSMISVGHIAGGCAALFGCERVKLFRPSAWNHSQKKEKTHRLTQAILGPWDTWQWSVAVKRKEQIEHVLDAVSMALWYLQDNFLETAKTA